MVPEAAPDTRPAHGTGPLLTLPVIERMREALARGDDATTASFDLGRTIEPVALDAAGWRWRGRRFAWPDDIRDRTIYFHDGDGFVPVSRWSGALIKLVPTEWGAPTFEIDGIKMLPTAQASPIDDARHKVALVDVRGKHVLDTCAGLGYFAACCLEAGAARIRSFEKNADVLWLRTLNPWSPVAEATGGRLELEHADVVRAIDGLADASFDAILHDPPRFGIAGELYAQSFYDGLARVIRRGGRLFHYTGMPNRLTSGRDVPREVARRLERAGFRAEPVLDGVLAVRNR